MAGARRRTGGVPGKAVERVTVDIDGILDAVGANWERPKGSITARELADAKGWPITEARKHLSAAAERGLMTAETGPNPRGGGKCMYYVPVKEGKR